MVQLSGMQSIRAFILPSYESNIPKIFIYQVLNNFMLFLPVWVIYLQRRHGLSLTQVTLLDSAFWLTMVVTEVPTGAVADTLGRKQSMIIGMVLGTGSLLLFGLAPNYPLLLLANSLWAFAITFVSGADMAFFYDTLRVMGREDDYPKYRGRLSAAVMGSIAVSGLLGGLLGEFSLLATFLMTAGMMSAGVVFLFWLKEPPQEADPDTGKKLGYREILRIAFGVLREKVELRYALVYSSLIFLLPVAIRLTFIQPHALEIGLPITALGIITLVIRLFQLAGAANADKTVERVGEWRLLQMVPLLVFIGVLAIGALASWVGIAIFAIMGFFSSATRPTIENVINRQTPGTVRATILSLDSLLFRLLTAILEPGVGLAADAYGLPVALIGMALVALILVLMLLFFWGRSRKREEELTAAYES